MTHPTIGGRRESRMSRSWLWLVVAVAIVGCENANPAIGDANLDALLGAHAFAGKWRCVSQRVPRRHWYDRPTVLCDAEVRHGTTLTLAKTIADPDGRIRSVNRVWWNRDSTEWMSRRDSLARALLARFPTAIPCDGVPAAYAPPPQAPRPGVIHEWRAWRTPGYDVEISVIGPASRERVHGGPLYTLSLDAVQAPGWTMHCGTEAQLRQLAQPRRAPAPADTARHS